MKLKAGPCILRGSDKLKLNGIRTFIVKGDPVEKKRPRFRVIWPKKTKKPTIRKPIVKTYTDKATKEYEKKVRDAYLEEFPDEKPFEGEIAILTKFYFPVCKSYTKKVKKMISDGEMHPTKKPDNDNLLKIVQDALNNVAYIDDAQIVASYEQKLYTDRDEGYVLVTIMEYVPE